MEEVPTVVVDNLNIPWEIAFLPDGKILVTERNGQLLAISEDKVVIPVAGVQHSGEGGLLGMALHPNFEQNKYLYLYFTSNQIGNITNKVERFKFENDKLLDGFIIVENIPGSANHNGGRIAFGPDGFLYITTGDASKENLAQDRASLAGKILRIKDDGSIPEDNPFGSAVYSYGHRNPQGLAWDSSGKLWSTEHGRSGIQSGLDEINLIEKGKNYGWPIIQGEQSKSGMETPQANSGASTTWAPGGGVFVNKTLFFTGLRGEALYGARIEGTTIIEIKEHYKNTFGRLRSVTVGPDGYLYLLTNNGDGRGRAKNNDDKIIKVPVPNTDQS